MIHLIITILFIVVGIIIIIAAKANVWGGVLIGTGVLIGVTPFIAAWVAKRTAVNIGYKYFRRYRPPAGV